MLPAYPVHKNQPPSVTGVLTDNICVSPPYSLCPHPLPGSNLSDHQKKVWQVPSDHNLPGGQAYITLPLPPFSVTVCPERLWIPIRNCLYQKFIYVSILKPRRKNALLPAIVYSSVDRPPAKCSARPDCRTRQAQKEA
jgi:hypothetical protein